MESNANMFGNKYTTKTSQADARKEILLDISNGDTSVIEGYIEYNQLDDQTPKNFLKSSGITFDITVEPPTEDADYWEVGVFGTKKGIDMLRIASQNYRSTASQAIHDMSRHTDRMFRGDEDNLVVECGFLSQLTNQSHRNSKYGFAHKTTATPHSQEMMDYVYYGIEDVLIAGMAEGHSLLDKRLLNGLDVLSNGGFDLDY
jgi:hypothetical protein